MSDEEEMSEEELDALISDLESRSSGGGSGEAPSGEVPEEDLDDFLQQIEQEDSGGGSVETAVADEPEVEAGPDLSELEGTDELPVEGSEAGPPDETDPDDDGAPKQSEKTSKKSASSGAESSESAALRYTWIGMKWTGFVLPVLASTWLLGAYLGQWVSAGWLILVVSTAFVFGGPKLLYDATGGRGRYRWWVAGFALLLTVGLTAPLSGAAGEALAAYGHWPGAVLTEIFGTDLGLGAAFGQLGEWFAGLLTSGVAESATHLDLGTLPAD